MKPSVRIPVFPKKRLIAIVVIVFLAALIYFNQKLALLVPRGGGGSSPDEVDVTTLVARPGFSLIPNIVHFFQFDTDIDLSFVSATCLLAAFFNQRPDRIVLHTNVDLTATPKKYLSWVQRVLGDRLEIRFDPKSRPSHVYGHRLSSTFHATDVARLQVLVQEGGVALDLDTFVVQPLTAFFNWDCSLGWPEGQFIGTQIIIARPHSKFIRLWLQTYKDYRPAAWYYNAAEAPTKHILINRPELIHRIKVKFGVHNLADKLYSFSGKFHWKQFYTIHLLARHRDYLAKDDVKQSKIIDFDEVNIQNYNKAFGEMARSIWNRPEVKKQSPE